MYFLVASQGACTDCWSLSSGYYLVVLMIQHNKGHNSDIKYHVLIRDNFKCMGNFFFINIYK